MDDDFGADDDDLFAALAASTSGPVSGSGTGAGSRAGNFSRPQPLPRPGQQQQNLAIQQLTPQRLDRAPPAAGNASRNNKDSNSNSNSNSNSTKITQPTPQPLPSRSSGSSILVSPRQKGNPVLACLRSLPWEYSDIPADYGLGATTCALFLSLKYHRLHPEYIYARIRNLQGRYALRVLLTLVDIPGHEDALRELSKTSLVNAVTVVLCWSAAEAARYLELYKAYERVADFAPIRGRPPAGYAERLVEFATVPRAVHRADAVALVSAFGSLRAAVNAAPEQVAALGGWGERKVKAWCRAVEEPFRVRRAGKRSAVSGAMAGAGPGAGGKKRKRGEDGEEEGAEGGEGRDESAGGEKAPLPRTSVLDEAIPIGRVPLRDMPPKSTTTTTTTPTAAAAAAAAAAAVAGAVDTTSSHGTGKPGRSGNNGSGEQIGYRPEFAADEDEEEAMIAAAIEASRRTAASQHQPTRTQARAGEDALSEGVAAALARLREKD